MKLIITFICLYFIPINQKSDYSFVYIKLIKANFQKSLLCHTTPKTNFDVN